MNLFRNPEFHKSYLLLCLVSSVVTVVAFLWEMSFGFFMFFICLMYLLIYYVSTYNRYKKISQLSLNLNKILHGDESIPLNQYTEGELAVLQNEIYKMTVRLREQQQNLRNDKIYLADSLADISHQIRTPLTSINLLVNFLSDPDITEERRRTVIHELYGLLGQIDWLITALLKISKLDAGTVQFINEQISMEELISKSVAPILIPMELREQTLEIHAEGSFWGDMPWTCEALTNIIKNCMEHTPSGGKIQIEARENPLYSEIVIKDNGKGIKSEDLPHIFERFYKGKDSDQKSFGIGLALARMIITAQDGTIKADNQSAGGARFTIKFYKSTI